MSENDEFGHYVPLLRRIIILVAVITAIPVVLWTITAFVRTYVGPPKIPTFHQLAAKASINEPLDIKPPQASNPAETPVRQARLADPPSPTATDGRGDAPAPKGPLLSDRAPASDINAQAAATPPAATPSPATTTSSIQPSSAPIAMTTATAAPKAADPWPPAVVTPKTAELATAPAAAPAPEGVAPGAIVAAAQPASEPAEEAMPASAPLPGPIPLPKRRPHVVAEAPAATAAPAEPATQTAPMTHMASNGPVPMPRPRPDTAPAGTTSSDSSSGGPLDFISNIFGGSK
jgi:hypothetical protein